MGTAIRIAQLIAKVGKYAWKFGAPKIAKVINWIRKNPKAALAIAARSTNIVWVISEILKRI